MRTATTLLDDVPCLLCLQDIPWRAERERGGVNDTYNLAARLLVIIQTQNKRHSEEIRKRSEMNTTRKKN
jgi:hypothetical protein